MKNELIPPFCVTLDASISDLSIGYWLFDVQDEAEQFVEQLIKGCTALPVYVSLTDNKNQFIKGYRLGDEEKAAEQINSLQEIL